MKAYSFGSRHIASHLVILAVPAVFITCVLFLPSSMLRAQSYPIKNDRILAPEVTHFTRPSEPGVDAHGDLSLSIPLMTVPGRDGLDFNIVANYRSGIQVTQSASWIGLGWELDVGSITRHVLGALANYNMFDGTSEHIDWEYAISTAHGDVHNRKIDSQPDAYMVNMNGNSTQLLSMTLEAIPGLQPTPARNVGAGAESGPCFDGQSPTPTLWYFIPSPWQPWKFCYAMSQPVTVDGKSTGVVGVGNHKDFSKFSITTEDGMRYIFGQPSLSEVYFPRDDIDPPSDSYQLFVSTWRLTAIDCSRKSNFIGKEVLLSLSRKCRLLIWIMALWR